VRAWRRGTVVGDRSEPEKMAWACAASLGRGIEEHRRKALRSCKFDSSKDRYSSIRGKGITSEELMIRLTLGVNGNTSFPQACSSHGFQPTCAKYRSNKTSRNSRSNPINRRMARVELYKLSHSGKLRESRRKSDELEEFDARRGAWILRGVKDGGEVDGDSLLGSRWSKLGG
jgi:hypothetical protein